MNPGVSLKTAAHELHLPYEGVRKTKSRLYRREDLYKTCPLCFAPSFRKLVCESCGFCDKPNIQNRTSFETQNPVHSIQPLDGLGSKTEYRRLYLSYGGTNVKHLVESALKKDPLLEGCKSLLWEEIKSLMASDWITEEATKLLIKEVRQFESKYPELVTSHKIRKRLVLNVMSLLKLRFPKIFRKSVTL